MFPTLKSAAVLMSSSNIHASSSKHQTELAALHVGEFMNMRNSPNDAPRYKYQTSKENVCMCMWTYVHTCFWEPWRRYDSEQWIIKKLQLENSTNLISAARDLKYAEIQESCVSARGKGTGKLYVPVALPSCCVMIYRVKEEAWDTRGRGEERREEDISCRNGWWFRYGIFVPHSPLSLC